jgi:hypothetical protein
VEPGAGNLPPKKPEKIMQTIHDPFNAGGLIQVATMLDKLTFQHWRMEHQSAADADAPQSQRQVEAAMKRLIATHRAAAERKADVPELIFDWEVIARHISRGQQLQAEMLTRGVLAVLRAFVRVGKAAGRILRGFTLTQRDLNIPPYSR